MTEDEVMSLAESAALFLRRLLDEGVPLEHAVQLTATFVSSHVIKDEREPEKPKRPWEDV